MEDPRLFASSPPDLSQPLRLEWECAERHSDGAPRAYRSNRAHHYVISLSPTRWVAVTRYGRCEIGQDGRLRLFHSPAAAAKWIEDKKEAFDPLAI